MTSLSSLKNPGELYAELVMSRTAFAGSFLIVEGDDDSRFWRRKIADGRCELVIAGGRINVEGTIAKVDAQRFAGALGIVDADFSGIDGTSPSPNLIYTEDHDLEAMLLQSSALDAVLVEYGDRGRIAAFEAQAGHGVREALLARGLPFGRLRWLALRLPLPLRFEKLKPARFVTRSGWQLDVDGLHEEAAHLCGLTVSELQIHLDAALGHDYPGHSTLGKLLRQALQSHELQATSLHRDIRAWEARNPPFLVLAQPSHNQS